MSNLDANKPLGERILDNIWLILFLGLAIPFTFYFFWGLWDIFSVQALNPAMFGLGG